MKRQRICLALFLPLVLLSALLLTIAVQNDAVAAGPPDLNKGARNIDLVGKRSAETISKPHISAPPPRVQSQDGCVLQIHLLNGDRVPVMPEEETQLEVSYYSPWGCIQPNWLYEFIVYGKYPSESSWRFHTSIFVSGQSFGPTDLIREPLRATIPEPPSEEDSTYTFTVEETTCPNSSQACTDPKRASVSASVLGIRLFDVAGGAPYYKGKFQHVVFRRNYDFPAFEVRTAPPPSGGQVVVDIFRKESRVPIQRVVLQQEGSAYRGEWDWHSNAWSDYGMTDSIPVGTYKAEAKYIIDGQEFGTTERLPFYVIFEPPTGTWSFAWTRYLEDEASPHYNDYLDAPISLNIWKEARRDLQPFNEYLFDLVLAALDYSPDGNTDPADVATRLMWSVSNVIWYGGVIQNSPVDDMFRMAQVSREEFAGASYSLEEYPLIQGECLDYAAALAAVLRSVGIPSRIATGIYKPNPHPDPLDPNYVYHEWTEVYLHGWKVLDAMDDGGEDTPPKTPLGPVSRSDWGPMLAEVAVGKTDWAIDGGWLYMNRNPSSVQVTRGDPEELALDISLEKCEERNYNTDGCLTTPVPPIPLGVLDAYPAAPRAAESISVTVRLDKETVRVGDAITATMIVTSSANISLDLNGEFAFGHKDPRSDRASWRLLYSEALTLTLPAQSSWELQRSLAITDVAYPNDIFRAYAAVGNTMTQTAEAMFKVLPAFDLSVSHPERIGSDEPFTVTAAMTNAVGFTLHHVRLSLGLPAAFQGDALSLDLGDLPPSESRIQTWSVAPVQGLPSATEEMRVVVSTDNGGQATSAITQAVQQPPRLVIRPFQTTIDVAWQASAPISFTVTNAGDLPVSGVAVTLTLPSGVQSTVTSWKLGSLGPGEARVLETRLQVDRATDFSVRLTAGGASGSADMRVIHFHVHGGPPQPRAGAFTDSYTELAGGQNGLPVEPYDDLIVKAGILITTTGQYLVEGYLSDANGDLIARANRWNPYYYWEGSWDVALDFDGQAIREHGVDGPYTLSLVALYDSELQQVDARRNAYTTTAYLVTAFGTKKGEISGTVRDTSGVVVPGARVRITSGPYKGSTFTDLDGAYQFSNLPPGDYTLHAFPPTSAGLKEDTTWGRVRVGETTIVDFSLIQVGAITGRVTGENGEPVQAEIQLDGFDWLRHPTNENGDYFLPNVQPGDTTVLVASPPGDWWVYVDGRHTDNGARPGVKIVQGRVTRVDFSPAQTSSQPDLVVVTSVHSGLMMSDEDVQYEILVRNLGNQEARGVLITDTLPMVASYLGEQHEGGFTAVVTGNQIAWATDRLAPLGQPGDRATIYLTAHLSATLATGDWVTNTVTSTSAGSEADYANNVHVQGQQTAPPIGDLVVYQNYSPPDLKALHPGDDLSYDIRLYFSGKGAAKDVVITNTLPISVTYVGEEHEPEITTILTGTTTVWRKPRLAAGESARVWIRGHASDAIIPGQLLTNTVKIAQSRPETNYANDVSVNVQPVLAPQVDLEAVVEVHDVDHHAGGWGAGDAIYYYVRPSNLGTILANDVVITFTFPVSTTISWRNPLYVPCVDIARCDYVFFDSAITGNTMVERFHRYYRPPWQPEQRPECTSVLVNAMWPSSWPEYVVVRISDTVQAGDELTSVLRVSTSDEDVNPANNVYTQTLIAQHGLSPLSPANVGLSVAAYTLDDQGDPLYGLLPSPGNTVACLIYCWNGGDSPAEGVVISGTLPVSTTFPASWSPPNVTVSGNTFAWNIGTLPGVGDPGPWHRELQVPAVVSEQFAVGTALTCTAQISTPSPESNYEDNISSWVLTGQSGTAHVAVAIGSPGEWARGSQVTYVLAARNKDWRNSALGVVVTDTLPSGMSYVSSSGAPTPVVQGSVVRWTIPGIAHGVVNEFGAFLPRQRTVYVTAYVSESVEAGTVLTNTAEITAANGWSAATDKVATSAKVVSEPTRDLRIGCAGNGGSAAGLAILGREVTYTIFYESWGNAHLPDIVLTNTLPAGVTFVSATGPVSPTLSEGRLVWQLGTLPGYGTGGPGREHGQVQFTVRVPETMAPGTTLINRVEASVGLPETGNPDNSCEVEITVEEPTRDVRVVNSLGSVHLWAGTDITYWLTLENTGGNWPAANVRVTDTLPVSATYVSWVAGSEPWELHRKVKLISFDNGQLVWEIPELPRYWGSKVDIILTLHLDPGLRPGAVFTNRAEVSTTDPEIDYRNNSSEIELGVEEPTRNVRVSTFPSTDAWPTGGSDFTYILDVDNSGANWWAANVRLTDTLPVSVTYVSWVGEPVPWVRDWGCRYKLISVDNGQVVWEIIEQPTGWVNGWWSKIRISLKVHLDTGLPPDVELTNKVEVSTTDPETDYDDNVAISTIRSVPP